MREAVAQVHQLPLQHDKMLLQIHNITSKRLEVSPSRVDLTWVGAAMLLLLLRPAALSLLALLLSAQLCCTGATVPWSVGRHRHHNAPSTVNNGVSKVM